MRTIFLSIITALLLLFLVLRFWELSSGGALGSAAYVICLVGVAGVTIIFWLVHRPLSATDARALASSWRTRFFVALGVAEAAALLGFVSAVIVGNLWLYIVGLVFALLGLWQLAPSRRNIASDQERLRLTGSPLNLTAVLMGSGQSRDGAE